MAKEKINNYIFLPGVSSDENLYPNAYALIQNNLTYIKKEAVAYIASRIVSDTAENLYPDAVAQLVANTEFLKEELTAWIQDQVSTATAPFVGYTFNAAKCKRDSGYVIEALIHDLRYGGNEETSRVSEYYWLGGGPQIDGDRSQEYAAYQQLITIINDYVLTATSYPTDQSPIIEAQDTVGDPGESGTDTIVSDLLNNVANIIYEGPSSADAIDYSDYNFAEYIYDSDKCERDIGYVLDGYLWDLRYGGNVKTRFNASRYWEGTVAQVDGDRKPEIDTHNFIETLINTYLLTNAEDTAKCERDIGYLIDGVQYDMALGTNYNSIFLGLAEYNSLDIDSAVINTINDAKTEILALSAVNSSATAITAVTTFFTEVLDIAVNGRGAANVLAFTNPTGGAAVRIAAKDRLISNRDFIADEINAWVAVNYPDADHDAAKCSRDVKYALDALTYDVLYGGNSATYDQAKFYFYGFSSGSPGIDPTHRAQTIAAYGRLKTVVEQVVLGTAVTVSTGNTSSQDLTGSNSDSGTVAVLNELNDITINVVNQPSQAAALTQLATYIRTVPDVTWAAAPIQTAKSAIASAKNTLITTVVTFEEYTPYQEIVPRSSLIGLTPESGATSRISQLVNIITDVIENGIYNLPARSNGVTQIKFQGYYTVDKLLLITNSTKNEIIYNFADPTAGGSIDVETAYNSNGNYSDLDYPSFIDIADHVTTITLKYDTSSHSATDDIQIFVDEETLKVRPYQFGTDAIERMRVAAPQAMLDADFEYGLQPTKWQAIGLANGYPSVYEIPGSDTAVIDVVTDASSGTGDVGNSLITVTTAGAHGFLVGTAITIKALAFSIQGFARAEGTFLISSIPNSTTFTYYATAKVGTTNGQILSTTYTQLRKADFYTGATVGQPTISVYTNGASSTLDTALATPSGTDLIAFEGALPALNSPITVSGVPSGTQVTGINGTGATISVPLQTTASSGSTTLVVTDATGLVDGLAVDRGDGRAVYITNVAGTTISLSGATTTTYLGGVATYSGVTGSNIAPVGAGATFDVSRSNSIYDSVVLNADGDGYVVGDKIIISGIFLEGSSPANDITITVTEVDTSGSVVDFEYNGNSVTGNTFYENVTWTTSGSGAGATINVYRENGNYIVGITFAGGAFDINDTITIDGAFLGGVSPTNDLVLTVTDVVTDDSSRGIVSFTQSGTAISSDKTFTGIAGVNYAPIGNGATFNITRTGSVYSAVPANDGSDYVIGDRITVSGINLGGTSPANDCALFITSADSSGNILSVTASGTPLSGAAELDFYSTLSLSDNTSALIPVSTTMTFTAIAQIQVTFVTPHGLLPGASVTVAIESAGSNHALAAGAFYIEAVPTATVIRYTARTVGVIETAVPLIGTIYTRSDVFFVHRPFDGGVQLGTGGPQHGAQAIRQSKKYIRYQSGKGAMYTTGALFAPSYNLQSLEAEDVSVNSLITVTTDDVDHGCQVGGRIRIIGVASGGYNGDYTVVDIINERVLKVRAQSVLSSTQAALTSTSQLSILNWHGSTVRAGCFDEQNGMFWEYNGQTLAVVRRSATFQLAGSIDVEKDANTVIGTNTRFRDQLKAGDRIVIRGMTHVVVRVSTNTQMTIAPDYRGANNCEDAKCCLIQDQVIKQTAWNIDKLDGTGASGYDVDITKMQMIGIEYSWYGAGFINFMLRGSDGNFIYCHRIKNSNINTEAYMRTGNMPVRYEVINEWRPGQLLSPITASQNTVPLFDATEFPTSGSLYIDNEIITYTGKTNNVLTGCTRGANLVNYTGGATRTYTAGPAESHTQNSGVILLSTTITPIISHWGSAYLIDGRFDDDRGYLFSYTSTGISVSTTKTTAFLIRLAPSVSNAIVGDLGDRELLNRAQLLLSEISITSDGTSSGTPILGGIVIEGVINPQNYPLNPGDVVWGGLQGLSQGGQPSFAQIAPGGSVNWNSGDVQATADGTLLTNLTTNLTVPTGSVFNKASGSSFVFVTKTSWDNSGGEIGSAIATSDTKFQSGTTITNVTASPAPTATTLNETTADVRVYDGAGSFNYGSGNFTFRFNANTWEAAFNPTDATGLYEVFGYFPTGTYITNVSSVIGSGSNRYYNVTFSNSSLFFIGRGYTLRFRAGGAFTNSPRLFFTAASWNALPVDVPQTGTATDDAKFANGTTITAISPQRTINGTAYYLVTHSNNTASASAGQTYTYSSIDYYSLALSKTTASTVSGSATITLALNANNVNTNYVYFTQASWESLVSSYSAGAGTEVSDAKFPANTRITTVSVLKNFGTTGYYEVTFNQTSNTVISAGSTITFRFGAPPYALPGETVFSFIANPGEQASLDLSALKELTNTTLGGRGTYPNGPDVLAINVYKVAGTAANANLVLRWSEAQA